MIDREKVIKGITHHKLGMCDMSGKICPYWNEDDGCSKKMLEDVLSLLKEQEAQSVLSNRVCETEPFRYVRKGFYQWSDNHGELIRCKDCVNWIPGTITDKDDFVPPKCGKYQQMVGHSADDYCSLAERKEGR